MKKFLSIVLTLALVLTSLVMPVSANDETVAVDISIVSDTEYFTAGSNIKLAAAATTLDGVKNIDLYANDVKLPGTIAGNQGEITWYDVTEGVYEVTAKVTYNDTDATALGNETIVITVLPAETELDILWPGNGITIPTAEESDEYAIFGPKSAKIVPTQDTTIKVDLKGLDKKATISSVLAYAPEEISGLEFIIQFYYTQTTDRRHNESGYRAVNKGFNRYCISTSAVKEKNYDYVNIKFVNVPENNTKPIYICGIYGNVNPTPVAPVAAADLDGAESVCNAVGTFRINFDKPVFPYVTETPVALKKVDGENETELEIKGYKLGTDYIDVEIPVLDLGAQYKVSILENKIVGYSTANDTGTTGAITYVGAADFTFSTKDTECNVATPVIKMSYPKAGAACFADTSLAAQVIAPNSTLASVKFFKGETELGEGVAVTNGEYWLETPAADVLTLGDNEITVKMFDAQDNLLGEAASATYTVVAKPQYQVKGIYDGAVIVAQEEASRTITVTDDLGTGNILTGAADVSRVDFYNDNVLVDSDNDAPYSYELVFDNFDTHKFEARVYDVYGNVHPFVSTYKVVNGVKNAASTNGVLDFENYTITDENGDAVDNTAALEEAMIQHDGTEYKYYGSTSMPLSVTSYKGSKAFSYKNAYSKTVTLQYKGAKYTTGHKVHYYEFDMATSNNNLNNILYVRYSYGSDKNQVALFNPKYAYSDGVSKKVISDSFTKVRIVLDWNAMMATVYFNDVEWNRVPLTGEGYLVQSMNVSETGAIYIDNFKYSVYDVDNTANFGTSVYDREYDVVDSSVTITTGATNTSGVDGSLINIIAVYDSSDRLLAVKEFDAIDYANGDFKTQTYNVAVTEEGAAKVRVFTLNGDDTLAPVGLYK